MRTLALLSVVALFGCAHHQAQTKQAAATPAPPPAPTPVVSNDTHGCSRDLDCADGQLCLDGKCVDISSNLAACTSIRVHFGFDQSDIDSAERDGLERAARCLKADRGLHIAIEGNADERGTEEYNMALGDKRARAVADYLRSLGASEQQMKTVSFGKERPLCSDHDEACWSQNRRADLVAANGAPAGRARHRRK